MNNSRDNGHALRRAAENTLRTRQESRTGAHDQKDDVRLVHELRVHQIELEMQNDELLRAQHEREASLARFADFYDFAPVGYLTVSEAGPILEANLTAASMLGVDRSALLSRSLTSFILAEDRGVYHLHSRTLFEKGGAQACELRLFRKDGAPFWVRLETVAVRETGSGVSALRIAMSDVTAARTLQRQLLDSLEALQTLTAELGLSEERERRRLALVLHDGVVQNLAVGKLQLDVALRTGQVADCPVLQELRDTLDASILDLRDLSLELSPPILYDLGIGAAMVSLGETFSKKYGFGFIFQPDRATEGLNEDLKVSIYQFFRELLTNVAKHASAANVTVIFRREGDRLLLSVYDDGTGFDSANCRSGFGLANIRQRVKYLKGELQIRSAPGAGTCVVMSIDTRDSATSKRARPLL